MSGKGSKRRPLRVNKEKFDNNWDKIFSATPDNKPKENTNEYIHQAYTRYPHLKNNG
jgi:hypothetical protein